MLNAASDSASLMTWIISEGTLSFKVLLCLWTGLQCLQMYRYWDRVFSLYLDNLIKLETVYNGVKSGVFAHTKLKIVLPSQPVTSCTVHSWWLWFEHLLSLCCRATPDLVRAYCPFTALFEIWTSSAKYGRYLFLYYF